MEPVGRPAGQLYLALPVEQVDLAAITGRAFRAHGREGGHVGDALLVAAVGQDRLVELSAPLLGMRGKPRLMERSRMEADRRIDRERRRGDGGVDEGQRRREQQRDAGAGREAQAG